MFLTVCYPTNIVIYYADFNLVGNVFVKEQVFISSLRGMN